MRGPLRDLLAAITKQLASVSETPRFEAELLISHACGFSRSALLARLNLVVDAPNLPDLIARRLRHEPMAYILGEWEFYSLPIEVKPPILVPRPETEHLVEAVLEEVGDRQARVLDLCTGSGCVAVAVAKNAPNAVVFGGDINPEAIDLARRNAALNDVAHRVTFWAGDLFHALEDGEPPFDVVCANPPYVEAGDWDHLPEDIRAYEDPGAVLAGHDGLDVVRRLVHEAPPHLVRGGLLAFEIGMGQYDSVCAILKRYEYGDVALRHDLAGRPRVVTARRR